MPARRMSATLAGMCRRAACPRCVLPPPAGDLGRPERRLSAVRQVVLDRPEPAALGPGQVNALIHRQTGHQLPLVASADSKLLLQVKLIALAGYQALDTDDQIADRLRIIVSERERQVVGIARVGRAEPGRRKLPRAQIANARIGR